MLLKRFELINCFAAVNAVVCKALLGLTNIPRKNSGVKMAVSAFLENTQCLFEIQY